ncbi:MAG: hypothetical protein M0P36_10250 [Bacteroidales bacterium]|nr:hypothetical protein [Bacteroidales bacterium]
MILFLNQKSIAQIDLRGSWYAYCIIENRNANTISFNLFCQPTISEDRSEIRLQTTKLIFSENNDSFDLITEQDSTKIFYQIHQDLNTLDFTYKDLNYSFSILTVLKHDQFSYILKSENGSQILIEKIE